MNWTVMVLVICLVVAAFAVWKEYKRTRKSFLACRIIASLLAVISLAGIALPLRYSKESTIQDEHGAILLTSGFEADSLKNYKNFRTYTTNISVKKRYAKAKLVRLDELKNDSPAISKLQVFGYGLSEKELKELGGLPVVFHPAAEPDGITSVSWNQRVRSGEVLTVQGMYKNDGLKSVKLLLQGLSTQLDTVTIAAKTNQHFELTTIPKNEGRAVYHVRAVAGADTLSDESLPVEIDPTKPLKVFLLSASPDFETRFLKNWLSENGFSVAVRSAISKGKFSSEYVNMEPLRLDHISSATLDKFDLVIGDLSALKSESAVLKAQVAQKGLGVIIRADSLSKASSWLQNDFPVERPDVKNQPPVSLIIRGKKGRSVPVKFDPAYIRVHPGTQPLVNDMQNHCLANASLAGAGQLVFTTISNTYNWLLKGDKDDYAAFWSLLISKATRKNSVTGQWAVTSRFPVINDQVVLRLETSSLLSKIKAGNSDIAPAQNPFITFEWNNKYWPTNSGWNPVKQNNGPTAWWYVYGTNEWQGVKASEKIVATANYAETFGINASVTKPIHEKLQIELPKIYFYLLLLAACTFLWVEGRALTPTFSKREGFKTGTTDASAL